MRTPGSLENEPVLISGKIIWEKNKFPVRITFLCKTGQPMSHHGDLAKKITFFTEHLPVTTSEYRVYFLLELKGIDVRM